MKATKFWFENLDPILRDKYVEYHTHRAVLKDVSDILGAPVDYSSFIRYVVKEDRYPSSGEYHPSTEQIIARVVGEIPRSALDKSIKRIQNRIKASKFVDSMSQTSPEGVQVETLRNKTTKATASISLYPDIDGKSDKVIFTIKLPRNKDCEKL